MYIIYFKLISGMKNKRQLSKYNKPKAKKEKLIEQFKIKILKNKLEEATGKKVILKEAPIPPHWQGKNIKNTNTFTTVFDTEIFISEDYEQAVDSLLMNYGSGTRFFSELETLLGYIGYSIRQEWDNYRNSHSDEDEEVDDEDLLNEFLIKEVLSNYDRPYPAADSNLEISSGLHIMESDFNESHLEEYFNKDARFSGKGLNVLSMTANIENTDDCILRVRATTDVELDNKQVEQIKNYLIGQFADGWGEGFEQRDFYTYPEGSRNRNLRVRYNLHAYTSDRRGGKNNTKVVAVNQSSEE